MKSTIHYLIVAAVILFTLYAWWTGKTIIDLGHPPQYFSDAKFIALVVCRTLFLLLCVGLVCWSAVLIARSYELSDRETQRIVSAAKTQWDTDLIKRVNAHLSEQNRTISKKIDGLRSIPPKEQLDYVLKVAELSRKVEIDEERKTKTLLPIADAKLLTYANDLVSKISYSVIEPEELRNLNSKVENLESRIDAISPVTSPQADN